MRIQLMILTIGLSVACDQGSKNAKPGNEPVAKTQAAGAKKADWKSVGEVSVAELETAIAAGCTVVDANGKDTREKFGIIPGAIKLANYREYDPTKVLPKDKSSKLVFYCSNTKCTAAPKAAAKAIEAGYTNVSHLKVGIKGWVEAGKKVDKAKTTEG